MLQVFSPNSAKRALHPKLINPQNYKKTAFKTQSSIYVITETIHIKCTLKEGKKKTHEKVKNKRSFTSTTEKDISVVFLHLRRRGGAIVGHVGSSDPA